MGEGDSWTPGFPEMFSEDTGGNAHRLRGAGPVGFSAHLPGNGESVASPAKKIRGRSSRVNLILSIFVKSYLQSPKFELSIRGRAQATLSRALRSYPSDTLHPSIAQSFYPILESRVFDVVLKLLKLERGVFEVVLNHPKSQMEVLNSISVHAQSTRKLSRVFEAVLNLSKI